MKINRLDAHDRLEHLTDQSSQSLDIGRCCQNLIDQRPFGNYPFYIFSHKRQLGLDERIALFNEDLRESITNISYQRKYSTLENVPTDRLIWQPRLTKPKVQTNSMLFKAYPGSDNLKVIWMIPATELWDQYTKGKMMENKVVSESIYDYQNNRNKLEAKEDDDLDDKQIDLLYKDIAMRAKCVTR